jgi:hypothetical protein
MLMKSGKKWTEAALTRTSKLEEIKNKIWAWDVVLYGEKLGYIEKSYKNGVSYLAYDLDGKYVGSGSSKSEARFFVAYNFVGNENMNWEETK